MGRGGKRAGAGRPKGSTKEPTINLHRRVTPTEKELLEQYLSEIRKGEIMFRVDIKADTFEWGTIAEGLTLEQAEAEIAHQRKMDLAQGEENEYRIIEIE